MLQCFPISMLCDFYINSILCVSVCLCFFSSSSSLSSTDSFYRFVRCLASSFTLFYPPPHFQFQNKMKEKEKENIIQISYSHGCISVFRSVQYMLENISFRLQFFFMVWRVFFFFFFVYWDVKCITCRIIASRG